LERTSVEIEHAGIGGLEDRDSSQLGGQHHQQPAGSARWNCSENGVSMKPSLSSAALAASACGTKCATWSSTSAPGAGTWDEAMPVISIARQAWVVDCGSKIAGSQADPRPTVSQ
jgi:hypothetical protein